MNMLLDPGSYSPPQRISDITLSAQDRDELRMLAGEISSISSDPINAERAELWRRLNDLEPVRPLVWINEIPWHEMETAEELAPRTKHAWARELETRLRRIIYQWRHLPGDMVVNAELECPLAIHSADIGIIEHVDVARTDASSDILPVRKVGHTHIWFTPWDYHIRWCGVEEVMVDMVDAWMAELDKFEHQNLHSLDCGNIRIG
jgi:hypothetical protein